MTSTKNHSEIAHQYARDIVDGKIPAGHYIIQACKRHLSDLDRSKSGKSRWLYDDRLGNRACKFIELMPHTKGKWKRERKKLALESWQCFLVCSIFGWVDRQTGLRKHREAMLFVPRKNGKALAIDTPIKTPNGWVSMGDLSVGDQVYSPSGEVRNIIAATDVMYDRECYRITTADGESIVADADHLWLTDSRSDRDRLKGRNGKTSGPKPSIKTTKEISETLKIRGENNHRIIISKAFLGTKTRLPINPYCLGFWIGDGSSQGGYLTIGKQDAGEISNEFCSRGEPLRKMKSPLLYGIGSGSRAQNDRSASFGARLSALNLKNNKHVPTLYLNADRESRLELLRGLMDSDGYCSKAGQCEFTTTKKVIADGVTELLWGLGFKPSIKNCPAKLNGIEVGEKWRISFFAYDDNPVFHLKRKSDRQKPKPKLKTRTSHRTIVECRKVESVPVRCIQVDHDDGMFCAGRTMLATHNSQLAAAIGLYMLTLDGESGPEVYSGATTQKQAMEVFVPAKIMVDTSPQLVKKFKLDNRASVIIEGEGLGKFEPIIGNPGDGSSPHCAIIDEYHEHPDDRQVDTMVTGMGARDQPLLLVITTAGDNLGGPCYQMQLDCQAVLDGVRDDDRVFCLIYAIDKGDDWQDLKNIIKANPNYGVSVNAEFIEAQLDKAKQTPRKQAAFQTKHCNVWVGARDAYFNVQKWRDLGDKSLKIEDFRGCKAYIGMDLASKTDLACVVALVLPDGGTPVVFQNIYSPEDTVLENENYQGWCVDGHITATDGAIIDQDHIKADLLGHFNADGEKVKEGWLDILDVEELALDPHMAVKITTELMAEGVPVVEVSPSMVNFSEPMKQLDADILSKSIRHTGCPVMSWMISNVTTKENYKGQVYPRKEREENKIDGVVALIMALGRAMVHEEPISVDDWLNNMVSVNGS